MKNKFKLRFKKEQISMKKLLFCTLIAFTFVFSSCNNEPVDLISTSCDSLKVTALPVNQSFTVNSKSSWSVESSEEWCTLSDSLGTGNKSLVVSFKDNLTGLSREAQIVIQSESQTKSIMVKQEGGTVLIDESFSNNRNSWILRYDSITNDVYGGYFHIKNNAWHWSYFICTKSLIPQYTGSYIISTHFKTVAGTAPFGIVFGLKDFSNYYRILLYPTGGIVVSNQTSAVYSVMMSANSSYVNTENSLTLVKSGVHCTIYVNDFKIGIFECSTPYGAYVGFFSCPQTDVIVDYLKINQL